jgi:hypothetical protein
MITKVVNHISKQDGTRKGPKCYWKQFENKQKMKHLRFMKCNNCIN